MNAHVPLLLSGEKATPIGTVICRFPKIRVAGVKSNAAIGKGDTLVFTSQHPGPRHRSCRVTVSSLEIDHKPVDSVEPQQACGIELGCSCRELPMPGDSVWLVRHESKIADAGNVPAVLKVPDPDLAP